MSDKLTPERAIRVLRAKAADLESRVLQEAEASGGPLRPVTELAADIALIASILADYIEQIELDTDDVVDVLNERERSFLDGFNEGRPQI